MDYMKLTMPPGLSNVLPSGLVNALQAKMDEVNKDEATTVGHANSAKDLKNYPEKRECRYTTLSDTNRKLIDSKVGAVINGLYYGADQIQDDEVQALLKTKIERKVHELREMYASPELLAGLIAEKTIQKPVQAR